jgi:restriction endonuclease Mrr
MEAAAMPLAGPSGVAAMKVSTASSMKIAWGKIDNKIALIDGQELAELMIDHDLGVSPMATYELKRIDADYFTEQSERI